MLINCILLVILAILLMFLIKTINLRVWIMNTGIGSNRWCSFTGQIIGRPKAMSIYSVEELEKMGMVGLYAQKRFLGRAGI